PNSKRPDDEGRMPSNNDGTMSNPSNPTIEGNDDSATTFIEDNAHPEGNTESIIQSNESEGEISHSFKDEERVDLTDDIDYDDVAQPVRRLSRQTKLPINLNDYVIDSKVKFGLNRVVNYYKLYGENLCFTTTLNKSFEPSNYKDGIHENNGVEDMNNEMESLNRNQTWEITDLP
nr:hypothetical protein [Tanacetum cinerariifolium]